ncbi:hypothetical protein KI387_005489, partial [Taxus chinensis]
MGKGEELLNWFERESDGREITPRSEDQLGNLEEGEIDGDIDQEDRRTPTKSLDSWLNKVRNGGSALKTQNFFLQEVKEVSGSTLEIPDLLLQHTTENLNKSLVGKLVGGRPNIDVVRTWDKLKWIPLGHLE